MGVIISDVWKAVKNAIKNGDFFLFKKLFFFFLCLYSIVIVDFSLFFCNFEGAISMYRMESAVEFVIKQHKHNGIRIPIQYR